MTAIVKVWSDADDVREVNVAERYSLEQVVEQYVRRKYDADWSDTATVLAQGPYESEPVRFSVCIEQAIDVRVIR